MLIKLKKQLLRQRLEAVVYGQSKEEKTGIRKGGRGPRRLETSHNVFPKGVRRLFEDLRKQQQLFRYGCDR